MLQIIVVNSLQSFYYHHYYYLLFLKVLNPIFIPPPTPNHPLFLTRIVEFSFLSVHTPTDLGIADDSLFHLVSWVLVLRTLEVNFSCFLREACVFGKKGVDQNIVHFVFWLLIYQHFTICWLEKTPLCVSWGPCSFFFASCVRVPLHLFIFIYE